MRNFLILLVSFFGLLIFSGQSAQAQCPTLANVTSQSHTDLTCFGTNNGTITVDLADASTSIPYNFDLFDVNTGLPLIPGFDVTEVEDKTAKSVTYTNVPPGLYRVVFFKSGCPSLVIQDPPFGFDISEPAELLGSVNSITSACTPGTGAIALDVSGGAAPYVYTWTGPTAIASTVEDPSGLTAGTYSVTVEDANNCTVSISSIVVPGQPAITLGSNPSVCTGTTSSSITYSSTSGSPTQYRIDWNAGGPPDVALTALPSSPIPITGIPAAIGTYNGTLYVNNGCESAGSPISVTVNPLPTATISYSGSPFCATGTANVTQTGQGGGTYSSTPGLSINASTGQINLATSTAGSYTVTYTFTNGTCPNTTTANVVINALPTATISYAGSPFCATGTANVTQTGQTGGTYSSTPGLSINAATGQINLATSTAGTYTVTYTFTNGTCPNTTTTNVTINVLPTATISYAGSPFCATGTVNVTRTGQAGGTYSSTPGLSINASTGQINLATSTAGSYTITYSFTNGTCPNTTTANVVINALPTATISYTGSPFCATGIANVTQTGQGGGTYSSTPGLSINASTGQINLGTSTAGSYTITYTFTNGTCPNTTFANVVINALPTATISYTGSPFCATGTANVTQTGQTGGTYSSTPGLSINASTGQINLATSTPGGYTITYTFTNGTCPNTTTANVTISAIPTATISYAGSPFCAIGIANVTQTGQGGGTYSSTPGLSINASTGQINLATSTAGSYTVTYSFTNGSCPNTTTANVVINALPTATISYAGSPFCATGTANVTQTGQGGGAYSSTPGLSINASTGQINLGTSTAGSYTVTYTFTNGTCPNTTTANVVINALPTATISYAGSPFCATGTANVTQTGQGGGTYSSTPGLSINASTGQIDLATSTPGGYTITYTFTNGTCPNTTTTNITINAVPTATISYAGSPFCATGTVSVTQTGQGGGTYSSTAGLSINSTTGDIDLAASTGGVYTVTYSFTNGTCPNTTTASVTINALPTAAMSGTTSVCDGQSATITVTFGGPGTAWDFVYSDGSTTFPVSTTSNPHTFNVTPASTTSYSLVSVTNGTCIGTVGGSATISINIPVLTLPPTVICESNGAVDLTTLVSATPAGGTFTFAGTGVTGNMFDPTGLSGTIPITVNYTDPSSCAAVPGTLNLDVTTTAAMVVPSTPVQVCEGSGSFDLNAYVSGTPGDYVFSGDPAITGDSFDPTGLSGLHTIFVDYVGACTAPQVSFQIDVITTPVLNTFPTATCENAAPVDLTTRVSPSVPGGTYVFSGHPNISGNMFDPSGIVGPVTINITVQYNVSGCTQATNTLSVSVLDPASPACAGGDCATVVVTPVATPDPCLNPAGEGTVTFNINPAVPAFNVTGVIIKIDKVVVAPESPYSLTQHNDPFFNDLLAGNYTYEITYGDLSCIKTGSFTVPSSGSVGIPSAVVETLPFCATDSTGVVRITVASPALPGEILEWSLDGITWLTFQNGGTLLPGVPAGLAPSFDRIINVRRSAADDCYASVTINIPSTNPAIVFGTGDYSTTQASCSSSDGTLTVVNLPTGGGGGPYRYLMDGVLFATLPAGNTFTGLASGNHILTVLDNFSCSLEVPFIITFPGFISTSVPVVSNADCSTTAANGQINFTITNPGAYEYAITTDITFVPGATDYIPIAGLNVSIPNLSSGTYYVWLRSGSAACPTRLPSIAVGGVYAVNFTSVSSNEACFGDGGQVVLSNIAGAPGIDYTYELFNVTTGTISYPSSLSPVTLDGLAVGAYQIRLIQDQSSLSPGCIIQTPFQPFNVTGPTSALDTLAIRKVLSYPEQPTGQLTIKIDESGENPYEVWVVNVAEDFASDTLTITTPSPVDYEAHFTDLPKGDYTVYIRDMSGCTVQRDVMLPFDLNIFIPNVFTPNKSDDLNSTFYVRNLPPSGSRLSVTDRWGKEVYSSSNYNPETLWDGGETPDGVYFYRLQVKGGKTYTGWIEILRGSKP